MLLRRVLRMLSGLAVMPMRHMRVMSCLLMVTRCMMLCSFVVMVGGLRVVLRSLGMMLRCFL